MEYPRVTLSHIINAFWQGMKGQRIRLLAVLLCVVAANIANIAVPIFYKQFFDVIASFGNKAQLAGQLVMIVAWVAGLNFLFWLLYRVATWFNNTYEPATMANLKQQAYSHLIGHSYGFFTSNFTGSLTQKVNRFARAFERLSDNFVWNLLPMAVRAVSIFVVVLFINRLLAVVILAWIGMFLAFNIIFSRWKLKYDLRSAEIDSKATAYLSDTITNQNTIALFGGLNRERQGYGQVAHEQAMATRKAWNFDAIIDSGQSFLGFAIQTILFLAAIYYWRQGTITVGVFFLLEAYLINLIDQLWGFTRLIRDFYQGYADSKEMVEIMRLPHEVKDVPGAVPLNVSRGQIAFQNVRFSFNQTRTVLAQLNLEIAAGKKVALVGPSGAGKTTLVRLLLRLYDPDAGFILIDGQNIAKVTQESLRQSIAMVPQDPVLFHRTLLDNIRYSKPAASRAQVEWAAKLAHCDEFIKDLPQGLDTYVGERGVKLSGGERQRVAIARAILKDAPILVLDEATSSLDSHSELLIQDALAKLMKGRTAIVIAHRLSTIQKMDRIVVVDEGKVAEQGSHQELLKKSNSLYRKLWTLQAGGFLTDTEETASSEVAPEPHPDLPETSPPKKAPHTGDFI